MGAFRIDRLDRNRVIGGFLENWQRGASFTNPAVNQYNADRFQTAHGGTMVFNVLRSVDVPTVIAEDVAPTYSLHIDVTTAQAVIGANDFMFIRHHIEYGFMRDLIGKAVTILFYAKSPKTGTHYLTLRNGPNTNTKTIPYTITAANTWQKVFINTTLENSVSYGSGVLSGLQLIWPLAAGSSIRTVSDNTWVASVLTSGAAQQNLVDNAANDFKIAMVDLVGGTFTADKPFALAGRDFVEELRLCQRYFEKTYALEQAPGTPSFPGSHVGASLNTGGGCSIVGTRYTVIKRAIPVVVVYHPSTGIVNSVYEVSSATARTILGAGQNNQHGVSEFVGNGGAILDDDLYYLQFTADAEL